MNFKNNFNYSRFQQYLDFLKASGTSQSTLDRKLSSLNSFQNFLVKKGYLVPTIKTSSNPILNLPPSPKNNFNGKNFVSRYLIFGTLIAIILGLGYGLYTQTILKAKSELAYSTATNPVKAGRILSFQGRLTDSVGNPITASTNVIFKFYNASVGGTELYNSSIGNSQVVVPDENGIFSVVIGKTNGTEIPSSVFSENAEVWLEITAGGETMNPRQQIATVAYALNSETLQGLPPSASGLKDTVLVIDSQGNLNLGETSPTIKSTSGTMAVEGQALLLKASDGSGGNITINPDGNGTIRFLTEGTSPSSGGFIDLSNANIAGGNLINSQINNDNRGYNFLSFQNYDTGTTTLSTRFSIDSYGNAYISKNLNLNNNLTIGGTFVSVGSTNLVTNLNANYLNGYSYNNLPYDNYQYWQLQTNGTGTTNINSQSLVNIISGTGISLYQNGSNITINSSGGIGTTYAATNGLNLNSGNFGLGGTLVQDTSINLNNHNLSLIGSGNFNLTGSKIDVTANNGGDTVFATRISGDSFDRATIDSWGNYLTLGGIFSNNFAAKDSTNNISFLLPNSGKNLNFRDSSNTNTLVSFTGDGNVGIGTTSPTQKLDINGSINIGGSMAIGSSQLVTNLNADLLDGQNSSYFVNIGQTNVFIQNITSGTGISITGSGIGRTIAVNYGAGLSNSGSQLINSGIIDTTNTTLTKSGSLGSYTLGLNLANSNTWTAAQNFSNITVGGTFISVGSTNLVTNLNANYLNGYSYNNLPYFNTASNGLNALNTNTIGLGGTLTQNTQIGTSSFNLSFLGLGGTQSLYIGSSGFVGIGNTNPIKLFSIGNGTSYPTSFDAGTLFTINKSNSASSWAAMSIISGTSGYSSLYFGSLTAENAGYVRYDNSANKLFLGSSQNDRLTINSTGNIGIGTTSPSKKLDIVGDINLSGTIFIGSGGTGVGTTGTSGQVLSSNGAGGLQWIAASGIGTTYTAGLGLTLSSTNVFSLNLGSTNTWTVLQTFGAGVDITGNLNVGGTATFANLATGSTALVTNLNTDLLDGQHSSYYLNIGQTGTFIQSLTQGVGISLDGTGIGRTIAVNFNSTNLKITSSQLNTIQDITTASNPTFAKLGLGSTSATYTLNVVGNGNFSSDLNVGTSLFANNLFTSGRAGIGTTGTLGATLTLENTSENSIRFTDASSLRAIIGISAGNDQISAGSVDNDLVIRSQSGRVLFTANGGAATAMTISGTNVGIGTTNPAQKLDVVGAGNFSVGITTPIIQLTAANGVSPMQIGSSTVVTNLNADLFDGHHSTDYLMNLTAGIGITITGTNSTRNIAFDPTQITNTTFGNGSTFTWTFNTGNTNPTINFNNNGYIGIGTSNAPRTALEVNGTIAAQKFVDLTSYDQFFMDLANSDYNSSSLALDRRGSIKWNSTYNSGWKTIDNGAASKIENEQNGLLLATSVGTTTAGSSITDWNQNIFLSNNGNVGIGTTNPNSKLEISGSTSTISNTSGDINIDSASGLISFSSDSITNFLQALAGSGSASLPSYSFSSDPVTGIFSGGIGKINIGTSGVARLTVDASGNVGIGTTNPTARLEIANSTSTITNTSGDITISAASGTISLSSNLLTNYLRSTAGSGSVSAPTYSFSSDTDTGMYAGGANILNLATGGNDRLTIDASGNVGIGTTSPNNILVVNNITNSSIPGLGSNSGDFGIFHQNLYGLVSGVLNSGSVYQQVQRIDGTATAYNLLLQPSGGNVGIGTTNPQYPLDVIGGDIRILHQGASIIEVGAGATANQYAVLDLTGDTTYTDYGLRIMRQNTGANADSIIQNRGTGRMYVIAESNGVYLASGATSWSANSDIRLKNITSGFTNAVESLMQLNPVHFTWKNDPTNTSNVGLIAQDVQKVLPEAVSINSDGYLGVRYTDLIPLLTAALQELNTKVDDIFVSSNGQIAVNFNVSDEVLASLGYSDTKDEIENATYSLTNSTGKLVTSIVQFAQVTAAKITAGLISAKNVIAENLSAKRITSETVLTGDLSATTVESDSITVSNTLTAQNIGASTATFSTVYASQIINPEGNISDVFAAKINSLRQELSNMIASSSATATPSAIATIATTWDTSIATDSADLTLDNLALNDNLTVGAMLTVNGQTMLNSANISNILTVGQIAIQDNILETTADNLYFQPSGNGTIHFLNDRLVLASDGSVTINGNVKINGSLVASLLQADTIETKNLTTEKINIATTSAEPIIATDASSSATATTSATLASNATVGTVTLAAGQTEVTIQNTNLTSSSMIYLTPNGSTQNQVPYLKNKSGDTFTIAIDSPLSQNVDINWWLIN